MSALRVRVRPSLARSIGGDLEIWLNRIGDITDRCGTPMVLSEKVLPSFQPSLGSFCWDDDDVAQWPDMAKERHASDDV